MSAPTKPIVRKRPKAEVSRALAPLLAELHAKYGNQPKPERVAS